MLEWLARRRAFVPVNQPPALSVGPCLIVRQPVALAVIEPVHDAVHARLERDAFYLKPAFSYVPKFLQRHLAGCSIGFAPLLH